MVEEFEVGYGAELAGPDGLGVDGCKVERPMGDMPVPAALPDEAGSEVRFVNG